MAGRPKRKQDLLRLQQEPDLGDLIIERLAQGGQLTRICNDTGLCKVAILEWMVEGRLMPTATPAHPSVGPLANARSSTPVKGT